MSTYLDELSYFPLANKVLRSASMAESSTLIEKVPIEEEMVSRSHALYRVRAHSLSSEISDLLLLADTGTQSLDVSNLQALRIRDSAGANHKSGILAYVTPNQSYLIDGKAILPDSIRLWSPTDLFGRIVTLPSMFLAELRDVTSIDRANDFTKPRVFQSREAYVHNSPGSGGQFKVNLGNYLLNWLQESRGRLPLVILGDRGSGKTWQALHFAQNAFSLHAHNPWACGPVFIVKLRELVDELDQATAATPILIRYILSRYRSITSTFDKYAVLGALLGVGHAVICVDGFDEMDLLPSDAAVRARFTSILLMLSRSTRFILTCRPGHFSSLAALLQTPSWSGAPVANTFEVLQLLPFDNSRKLAYVNAMTSDRATGTHGFADFLKIPSGELDLALSICARHPALLAYITEKLPSWSGTRLELIGDAIRASVIEFNLKQSRTREEYLTPAGEWIDLSLRTREDLLSDLSWYMAARGQNEIDLANLPLRICRTYGINDDALQRDLRSQTAFELVHSGTGEVADAGSSANESLATTQMGSEKHGNDTDFGRSLVRFILHNENAEGTTDASVAGAYFLARYIAERITGSGPHVLMSSEVRLRFLGKVLLHPMTCSFLREMIESRGIAPRALAASAWNLLTVLAQTRNFQIFSPWYRHLVKNLETLGALSPDEARILDPWSNDAMEVMRPPDRLPQYEMVLVSPPNNESSGDPFLIGLHEVTNEQYLSFVLSRDNQEDSTVHGPEWSVSRMTLAGSNKPAERSKNFVLSNEYHLFEWLPTVEGEMAHDEIGQRPDEYRPRRDKLRHPVTYVSYFACAAFCDWLSLGSGLPRHYKRQLLRALGQSADTPAASGVEDTGGFRLPQRTEWFWAARGGKPDVNWPWNLFPYYRRGDTSIQPDAANEAEARYLREQSIMRDILLDTGKTSYEVLYDEPNELGVSGLVGNVREWCNDAADDSDIRGPEHHRNEGNSADHYLVLGATGYLGRTTFDFTREYRAPLFPQNTNPDVGFRVARSLSVTELGTLVARQSALATLPQDLSG